MIHLHAVIIHKLSSIIFQDLSKYIEVIIHEAASTRGKTILKRLGSAQMFYKSNFPALFSNLFLTEKCAGKFNSSQIVLILVPSNLFYFGTRLEHRSSIRIRDCIEIFILGVLFGKIEYDKLRVNLVRTGVYLFVKYFKVNGYK